MSRPCRNPPFLFASTVIYSSFLTSTGLEKYMQSHGPDAAIDDPELVRATKVPRVDTVLNRTPADIPTPPKAFTCPLCQTRIGRKGLAGQLRNEHQIDKPEFFSFRPSRDMMPGRLGWAHYLNCFTIEAALKLHYQRATCPALLIEWVKDLHSGPVTTVDHATVASNETESHSTDLSRSEPPMIEQAQVLTADLTVGWMDFYGLQIPEDAPAWHSSLTHDLCVCSTDDQSCLQLPVTLTIGPEHHLRWFVQFTPWLAHFCTFPQAQIEHALPLRLLHVCTRVHPIFWAWTSNLHLFRSIVSKYLILWGVNFNCFRHVSLNSSTSLFQWCLHQGLTDGSYERRGSTFCRSDGNVFHSLQMTTAQRGGTLIRTMTLPPRAEEVIALIGFGLGRRLVSPDYVSKTDFETGGSVESIEFGSHLPSIHPGWQEFDPPATATAFEDMAWPAGAGNRGSTPPPADVSVGFRRACEPGSPVSIWVKRPRIDPGPSRQADLDPNECLELPSVGSPGKDSEAFVQGTDLIHRGLQDDRTHPSDCQPVATDPQVHGTQTDAIRSAESELQCCDPMAPRHFPSQLGLSGIVRPPHEAHGQRPDAVDCSPVETFDLAEVPAGAGGGPDPQTIRSSLLELCLGNDVNDCFMNMVLIVELWACCMDNNFSWGLTGNWKQPLLRLLARGPTAQRLTDSDCLGSLLDGMVRFACQGYSARCG